MVDRFVSRFPLPTDRERELLTILIEECAEVQQRATKMLRFGRDEIQPSQSQTNMERLGLEVGDLYEMVEQCIMASLIAAPDIETGRYTKRGKLQKYLQSVSTTPTPIPEKA